MKKILHQYIIQSELLNQKITATETFDKKYVIDTEDGVHYTAKEVFLICFLPKSVKFNKQVHIVKKIFDGEIIKVESNTSEY